MEDTGGSTRHPAVQCQNFGYDPTRNPPLFADATDGTVFTYDPGSDQLVEAPRARAFLERFFLVPPRRALCPSSLEKSRYYGVNTLQADSLRFSLLSRYVYFPSTVFSVSGFPRYF